MEELSGLAGGLPSRQRTVQAAPPMPALAPGKHSHHHSIHSALATLLAMGVQASRISVERTGRDAREAGAVVGQSPAPGEPLFPDTRIRLRVAGLGFTHALPVGMWDSGGETHVGTRELLEGIDDPLEKLKHWFHEGAPLFRLSPNDPGACARWITLFGMDPEQWPRALWFRLATLVANLPQYSCSQAGCAFVLSTLLGLPVQQFRYRAAYAQLPDAMCSRLGRTASRLGVDLAVGDMAEEPATLVIEIGPVALERYEHFQETPDGRALLRQVLELVTPMSQPIELRWSVLDKSRPPQLGVRDGNSRLGINTHMGGTLGAAPQRNGSQPGENRADDAAEQPAPGVAQLLQEPLTAGAGPYAA